MASLNKMEIIGHLGRDPEMRYSEKGLAIANFSVAVTEKEKGEDFTQWFKVTAFDKLAEICGQYLKKGSQVFVEGRLKGKEYDKKDGTKGFSLEIIARMMLMLNSKSENSSASPAYSASPAQPTPQTEPLKDENGEDIPF